MAHCLMTSRTVRCVASVSDRRDLQLAATNFVAQCHRLDKSAAKVVAGLVDEHHSWATGGLG